MWFFADSRALMVLQDQLARQDKEALWVFLVKEESAGCRDFLDLRCVLLLVITAEYSSAITSCIDLRKLSALHIRAHQENREQRDRLERKDHRDLSASLVLTGLVVIQVLM